MTKTFKTTNVPAPGFGTYQLNGKEAYEGVRDALEIGYRHIDTAQMYQNEESIAKAIKESAVAREDIFLTTKVWYTELEPNDFKKAAYDRLKKLDTDYLDLLLIHWPTDDMPLEQDLDILAKMQSDGLIRHYGVSNFNKTQLNRAIEHADVFALQVEYHPLLNQDGLMEICKAHDMMFTSYTPLAKASHLSENNALVKIAETKGKTPQQIAIRWHLQQSQDIPIPRSSSHTHRVENFNVLDFELSEDEMSAIFKDQGHHRLIDPEFGPDWGG